VPVIMVSADVYENRPELMSAAQAQAFVGKPVIESELLDRLRLLLDLEWIHDAPAPALPPQALQPLGDLPPEAAGEMLRLARIGYAQGVREVIDRLIAEDPRMRRNCAPLKALLDRFDLDALARLLAEKNHAVDA
jgi:hypothetical protein